MIRHQHIPVDIYTGVTGCVAKNREEELVVEWGPEDRAAVIPALNDVLTESRDEESRSARHGRGERQELRLYVPVEIPA